MLIEIDARGLACPKPVINTKKELDKLENGVIRVTVDNTMAKENIIKLSKSSNCESSVLREEEDLIVVEIIKGENIKIEEGTKVNLDNKCIFISSDKMGQGNDELGEVLIKGYIYTLTETKPYPKHIVFVNSGVKLTTVNEATVENLKILENNGVEILSCGTCLDYYNLKELLQVGTVTNMYNIVEMMNNSLQTISI
ncbi:sulfurtransferase-like selenium metabolism protein YedF [Romboutsia sp. 1001216sp1]|uniref:sulfurtransferase-like selenium metabolism protein YedF n=1 Tax=unclassified Romboutsia TaxID=2626894 RepID=UPI0018A071A2|nr:MULTISPECIES: sulfurtransferase-like selenium metabolism protein YedF [unclassified Romboutsia]MDB8790793.1 sulfurtransferase-like selenium metabolism protein YedF [Romboutsia sp. 1001216sp1]MDB8802875.1 sulfurtransferase-like selenium metabolism protein YedF [Romboutsia sp. 1001216sp1]MDB8814657.1 sulfurtransferase-like selenium metabolism protein YedF [Romboutsia sp. 1001216sp1]